MSTTRSHTDTVAAHVVKIYDDDRDLARGVGEFLGAGIAAGDAVIVVATPEHGKAFERSLDARHLAEATAEGRYLPLDAAEALSRFMVDGAPDRNRFDDVIGGLIRSTTRRVRIFGEMVAVLWDEGNVTAAIALESLWNELATRHDFSLYCAYSMVSFESASDLGALREVCDHHSDIVAPEGYGSSAAAPGDAVIEPTVSELFVPVPLAVRGVRQLVESTLLAWGKPELLDDAAVVASELATNAVRHARSPFRVSLARVGATVRMTVHDGSDGSPEPRSPALDTDGGRGLTLVGSMCSSWGTERVADGKIVWVELAHRAA